MAAATLNRPEADAATTASLGGKRVFVVMVIWVIRSNGAVFHFYRETWDGFPCSDRQKGDFPTPSRPESDAALTVSLREESVCCHGDIYK